MLVRHPFFISVVCWRLVDLVKVAEILLVAANDAQCACTANDEEGTGGFGDDVSHDGDVVEIYIGF